MCLQVIKGLPTKETEEIEIKLSFATRGDIASKEVTKFNKDSVETNFSLQSGNCVKFV